MFRYYFYTFSEFYNNSHNNKNCSIEKLNKELNDTLFYRLPSNIKAKILDIDVYSTIVIFKIEILSEVKDEDVKNNEIEIKERFLCENEAKTLFSCETENNKIVSICENDNKTISYKYGFPDKIELEYSSKEGEDINKYFKYNSRIHRGGLYELEFNIGKYTYTVFKYLADFQISHSGLSVEKNGKTLSIINCIYPEENNYNNLYKLETDYNINGTDNIKDITGELVG